MSDDVALPAPLGLRRDATLSRAEHLSALQVVHVGHSAIVLGAPGRLVPVTGPDRWLVPGGLHVTSEREWVGLLALARRTGATCSTVSCDTWLDAATRCDLTLPARPSLPSPAAAEAASAGARADALAAWSASSPPHAPASLDRARRPVLALAAAAVADPYEPDAVRRLVGAGPGTTPTGDDLLVGMLAGLLAGADRSRAHRLGATVLGLLHRTTRASRHELAAAVDGRFGEALRDVVTTLTEPGATPDAVLRPAARLATWGASSGRDQAHGAALAVSALLATSGPSRLADHPPQTTT
ncbi:DUF2877 domain-containing protein [Oerskovia jenensis]|uniref:DUF2877 domain-containing protein n=1 Tax=Oerskovia jenensis TaxID=162169 RepID=A0ABS2LBR1_9CELL|nr:DUF2877 domain-containing protein [Oerskovia jenensis]MBM7477772.1 hypothetical protein [Oerskovia jenensis]